MRDLWRDEEAAGLAGVDLLVYRSRLIGREPDLVLWGAGNTSLKHDETDRLGRTLRVLRIKGSGADLRAAEPAHFPGLRLADLEPLVDREAMSDEEMVAHLRAGLVDPDSPRPSIETLLHAFLPWDHVDHTHADAILALTDTQDGRRHVEAALGRDVAYVPYRRPGHRLAVEVARAARALPEARGVVLERHGLVAWGRTAKECYQATLALAGRAEEYARARLRGRAPFGTLVRPALPADQRRAIAARLMPHLRGLLSRGAERPDRVVLRYDDGEDLLDFAGRESAPQAALGGPATPDHLMYTRVRPLVVVPPDGDLRQDETFRRLLETLARDLEKYAAWYEVYFRKHRKGGEPEPDRRPRVVLVPRVGLFTAWRDARSARLVADVFRHGLAVQRAAQAIGEYRSLTLQDAFDVEFWPLEIYRMSLRPAEGELARRVALLTGAARGIGRAIALRLAAEGCHVVVTDLSRDGADDLAGEIVRRHGPDRALAMAMDVTEEAAVEAAFRATALAYGGLDIVVSNAGVAHVSPVERMEAADWRRSMEVNATGHFLVARAAMRLWRDQGIGGSLVFVASKNVLAPGKDFAAYSASKAAQTQLARVLAIEGGALKVRVNLVNPDAVFGDSGLWSGAVREERARAHGIRPDELEEFYRRRTLLGERVSAEDVAEAALFFASDRSLKTTGCILTVDGGVREAFPR